MNGKLIIFSAPSGAGKTTLVKKILESRNDMEFSISVCSRNMRPNEKHGVDYYFISADEFRKKINNDEFLEWEEVYENNFYGTLKSELERIWNKGKHVIFDVDVIGGLNIKKYGKENALAIFVMPPSMEELENRLKNRSTETAETLKKRLDKATYEISFAKQFDIILINDHLEEAVDKAKSTIDNFLSKDK
ncbi:MAG TPA: guanylate kinase [Bacteroidales bacterium]|nr:guanylate kinase [Bacteroidales bacterium]HPS16201.1 guanylate kinase [Bacteroidales bacterium]